MSVGQKRLKRHIIFEWICAYAQEHKGNSPSIRRIGREFGIAYHTARGHVLELIRERKVDLDDDDKVLIVVDSDWTPPPY